MTFPWDGRQIPVIIGHRGASGRERENTLAAFAAASEMGADMVEFDVRRTADGVLAIHHDAFLSDGRAIAGLTWSDAPDYLTDLPSALGACEGMLVNVEIKDADGEPDYEADASSVALSAVAIVRDLGWSTRVEFSSFNLASVDRLRTLAPDIATGRLLMTVPTAMDVADAAALGHVAIHPHQFAVTEELIATSHEAGIAVVTWTVNDPDRILQLAEWGIDGIITDHPDVAMTALGRSR